MTPGQEVYLEYQVQTGLDGLRAWHELGEVEREAWEIVALSLRSGRKND